LKEKKNNVAKSQGGKERYWGEETQGGERNISQLEKGRGRLKKRKGGRFKGEDGSLAE